MNMNTLRSMPAYVARTVRHGLAGGLTVLSICLIAFSSPAAAGSGNYGDYPAGLWDFFMNDWLFQMLVISIAVLLVCSAAFTVTAIRYRIINNRKAERWSRLEAEWKPKIMLMMDGTVNVESVIKTVTKADQLYFVDYLTRFAHHLRGDALNKISELAQPFLADVASHLSFDSPAQRAHAVQTLGLLGFNRYYKELIVALDDQSPLVAMIAARALARSRSPQYIEPVLNRLYRFDHLNPKFLTSLLVGLGPEAAPFLRTAFADKQKSMLLRAVIGDVLRELNDLPAAEIAHAILRDEVIRTPVPAAGEQEPIRGNLALGPVSETQTMMTDRDGYIHPQRDLIASSLRILRVYGRPAQAAVVRELVGSPDFLIREVAMRALGKLGSAQDIPCLRQALDDPSIWVAIQAARAIRELGDDTLLREIAETDHPRTDVAKQVLAEEKL